MKCDVCGKEFEYGNYPDGTPNGITMQLRGNHNQKNVTLCRNCIIKYGMHDIQTMQKINELTQNPGGASSI